MDFALCFKFQITVLGRFRKPYMHLGVDPVSKLERPLYLVIGDVIVPANCVAKHEYRALFIPNLPGEVELFISLNGMTPASQIIKLTFPKTKKSQSETQLEEKLANLLATNEKDRKSLMRKLKQCDNKKTYSERILREYLKDWLFDNCRTVNCIDGKGHQIIHLFASLGYAWAIAIFKRFGFTFDAKHGTDWTPLHCAAFYGRKGAATALLIGRADPTLLHQLLIIPMSALLQILHWNRAIISYLSILLILQNTRRRECVRATS